MCRLSKINLCSFAFVVHIVSHYSATDYCKASICGGSKEHTLCKFTDLSPNCVDYEKTIRSKKDKQLILDKINSRRNKVASGEIRSLPAAQSMIKLEWNDELALSAQRWADQCVHQEQNVEDVCRDLENTSVGQNVATIYGESPGISPFVLVDLWYMELLNFNASIIPSYQPSSITGLQHYDYFTQLIWGSTSEVGCGGIKFKEIDKNLEVQKNKTVYRLVCNFAPIGNRLGEVVYTIGDPCFKCPRYYSCDSEYQYLCSKSDFSSNIFKVSKTYTTYNFLEKYSSEIERETAFNNSEITKTDFINTKELQNSEKNDSGDSFDLLSHLFETTTSAKETTQSTFKCKDVVAVEEFIRLLKNKLNNEQLIREYLFSTKALNLDSSPSDETVAAIVQQIYSKNIPSTSTTVTESETVNSTLLANLVEAVIFRQSDKFSVTEKLSSDTLSYHDVRPVKIQASLGEIKTNNEFSGHYFFPEEETSNSETTESDYDSTNLPLSEIAFEIDDINKSKRTRSFLDEVLEEELLKEDVTEDTLASTIRGLKVFHKISNPKAFSRNLRRLKRRHKDKNYHKHKKKNCNDVMSVNYFNLLKKLATDLRHLKLRECFSCAFNRSFSFINVSNSLLIYILILHPFLSCIY